MFQAPRAEVLDATRRYLLSRSGGKYGNHRGLARGSSSFSHAAIANFRIQPAGNGTKVELNLLVERAGPTGFMLFDVGGYYSIQIRKWLDGIQWAIHQQVSGTPQQSAPPIPTENKTGASLFNGCLLLSFAIIGLWFLGNFISGIVGLPDALSVGQRRHHCSAWKCCSESPR